MGDLERYQAALAPIEVDAETLPWADRRRWRVRTHVGLGSGVVVVDLHDLSAALARAAVRAVVASPPEAGAVVFVHGAGRHSDGRGPVLRHVVADELARACRDTDGRVRSLGPARVVWLADPSRAPSALVGEWGCAWRVAFALLVLAFLLGLWAAFTGP